MAVGAADTAAALFAAGLRADEAMLNLGSGGQWVVHGRRVPARRRPRTTNLYRAVGDGYYRLAPVQNVGVTLDWVRNLLGATWEELYDTAARPRPPGRPALRPLPVPGALEPGARPAPGPASPSPTSGKT